MFSKWPWLPKSIHAAAHPLDGSNEHPKWACKAVPAHLCATHMLRHRRHTEGGTHTNVSQLSLCVAFSPNVSLTRFGECVKFQCWYALAWGWATNNMIWSISLDNLVLIYTKPGESKQVSVWPNLKRRNVRIIRAQYPWIDGLAHLEIVQFFLFR
jgi:hypothetical protein